MASTTIIQNERIVANDSQKLKIALWVIATAQLMFVLDDTIANIVLPSIQREMSVPTLTLPYFKGGILLLIAAVVVLIMITTKHTQSATKTEVAV